MKNEKHNAEYSAKVLRADYERIRNLKKLEDFTRACIGENDCPNCRLFDFAELECTRERLQRPPYCSRCGAKMDGEENDDEIDRR